MDIVTIKRDYKLFTEKIVSQCFNNRVTKPMMKYY